MALPFPCRHGDFSQLEVVPSGARRVVRLAPGLPAAGAELEPALAGVEAHPVLLLVLVPDAVVQRRLERFRAALEDHDLVAALEMDDDPRVGRQVAPLARRRLGAEDA